MKIKPNNLFKFPLAGLLLASFSSGGILAGEEFKEELHQTIPLASDGHIKLDNVNGTVHIAVWDRPEVKLAAVKKARKKEHLEAVKIKIENDASHLSVETKYPKSKWWANNSNSTTVDYTLTVPATAQLDQIADVNGAVDIDGVRGPVNASTVNGALSAKGLAANTTLNTVNGAVTAGFASLPARQTISISTVNGSVNLDLPDNANADLSASTVNGNIGGDISVKKNWPIGKEVKTKLGDGGSAITLNTVNGGMQIHLVKPAK